MNAIMAVDYGSFIPPILILTIVCIVGRGHFANEVTPELLSQGLTIVLPGIEGRSRANSNIAVGLRQGGVKGAVEVVNWTTGCFLLFLYHLRRGKRNHRQAAAIADRIVQYQSDFPERPVHLVGHSGGGGMIGLILQKLPVEHSVTTATLIAPAMSPGFPMHALTEKTTGGVWHHYSLLDIPLLIIGTTVAGTFDGRHMPAAGAFGFRKKHPDLHEIGYQFRMLKDWHPGGHFGCTDPVFIRRWIAPVLVNNGQCDVESLPVSAS